jgi:hypothetical protein
MEPQSAYVHRLRNSTVLRIILRFVITRFCFLSCFLHTFHCFKRFGPTNIPVNTVLGVQINLRTLSPVACIRPKLGNMPGLSVIYWSFTACWNSWLGDCKSRDLALSSSGRDPQVLLRLVTSFTARRRLMSCKCWGSRILIGVDEPAAFVLASSRTLGTSGARPTITLAARGCLP